jgi:Domain of unknown function (DUF4267)
MTNSSTQAAAGPLRAAPAYRFAGFWLAALMALLMFVNFGRSWLDPAAFAQYMGLPLEAAGAGSTAAAAWVKVYGLRALFIGLVVSFLLWRHDAATLRVVALLALVMSLGDAWLAHGAGSSAWLRHGIISGVLVLAALALQRWHRARQAA